MAKIEISDKEFNRIQADKRHKALLAALKGIKIPEPKQADLTPVMAKIEAITDALTGKLQDISKPTVVVQKTEVSQKEIVNSLSELIVEIKGLKNMLSTQKKQENREWVFDVVRNSGGFIQSVNVRVE